MRQRDRREGECAAGAAPHEDLLDRVARHGRVGWRLELDDACCGRREVCERSSSAPPCNLLRRDQRRRGMHLAHEGIVDLMAGERNSFEPKRIDVCPGLFRRRGSETEWHR